MLGELGSHLEKKINLDLYLVSYQKINFNGIRDLKVHYKTIQRLEEDMDEYLFYPSIRKGF